MTVHVSLMSTINVLQTVSVEPQLPILQSLISFHSSMLFTNSHLPPAPSSAPILTNPLRPSITASGIWFNTTTSDVVAPSPSGISVSQTSSGKDFRSTFYLTMTTHTTSTAASVSTEDSVSTDGVATPSTINSTLALVVPSATQPIPTSPIPEYGSSSLSSATNSSLKSIMPLVSDVRPTSGFAQSTVSVSENFISLPSDTETSWSIAGDESTVTDMEDFPTIKPDAPTSPASVLTVGTFFSDVPPYPTAAPVKRNDGDHEINVNGTISKVYMTTSVALQGINSTVTVTGGTGSTGTMLKPKPKPSANTESLSQNGAGNTQSLPAWLVVVVLTLAAS
jgi:hypothetical protein